MNELPAESAAEREAFEALRQRWRKAKENGTLEAFALELWEENSPVEAPADAVYESEEERALYERARELCPPKPSDILDILPLYFGEEKGIPLEQVIDELEALAARNGPTEAKDGSAK